MLVYQRVKYCVLKDVLCPYFLWPDLNILYKAFSGELLLPVFPIQRNHTWRKGRFWKTFFLWKKSCSRWWFQILFYVHPYLGKWSNLTISYFSDGLKPPTCFVLMCTSFLLLFSPRFWSSSYSGSQAGNLRDVFLIPGYMATTTESWRYSDFPENSFEKLFEVFQKKKQDGCLHGLSLMYVTVLDKPLSYPLVFDSCNHWRWSSKHYQLLNRWKSIAIYTGIFVTLIYDTIAFFTRAEVVWMFGLFVFKIIGLLFALLALDVFI